MVWTIFGRPVRRDRVRTERIVVGDVALDPATGSVAVGGWLVRAPDREAQLMEQLMRHPGRVLATEALACSLQVDPECVGRLARRLRRRLMVDPLRPPLIEVVPSSGYRFLSARPVDAAVPRRDERPGAISPRGRPS
jgi:DNA-binding response OmpR family regulator